MRISLKVLFPATLCALTLAAQSQTQQTAPVQTPVQSSTVLKITSRLVVGDVVALDHKGQPVTDLTAEDFTVLEEGKEQKVSAFSFQRPGSHAGGSAAMTAPVKLLPRMFPNIPRQSTSGALNVVLLDALNTQTNNQAYVRE